MADDNFSFRYDQLVETALRGVVRQVLVQAAAIGLPGDHHFYLTFRTTASGVRIPPRLKAQHPEEMTIVLQHQFWDLAVGEEAFEVTLSFGGASERLRVPFAAITGFADPSAKFGLKFQALEDEGADEPLPLPQSVPSAVVPAADEPASQAEDPAPAEGAKVVALDAFRKK